VKQDSIASLAVVYPDSEVASAISRPEKYAMHGQGILPPDYQLFTECGGVLITPAFFCSFFSLACRKPQL